MCGITLPDAVVADYEARLLRPYHALLLAALAEQQAAAAAGGPPPDERQLLAAPPYDQLLLEFKLAAI